METHDHLRAAGKRGEDLTRAAEEEEAAAGKKQAQPAGWEWRPLGCRQAAASIFLHCRKWDAGCCLFSSQIAVPWLLSLQLQSDNRDVALGGSKSAGAVFFLFHLWAWSTFSDLWPSCRALTANRQRIYIGDLFYKRYCSSCGKVATLKSKIFNN